jgi:hypothetical protein
LGVAKQESQAEVKAALVLKRSENPSLQ